MELKIEHLSKQFKDKTAVNDVNLTLTPGVWVQILLERYAYSEISGTFILI